MGLCPYIKTTKAQPALDDHYRASIFLLMDFCCGLGTCHQSVAPEGPLSAWSSRPSECCNRLRLTQCSAYSRKKKPGRFQTQQHAVPPLLHASNPSGLSRVPANPPHSLHWVQSTTQRRYGTRQLDSTATHQLGSNGRWASHLYPQRQRHWRLECHLGGRTTVATASAFAQSHAPAHAVFQQPGRGQGGGGAGAFRVRHPPSNLKPFRPLALDG